MNITYIIGLLLAIVVIVLGMANGFPPYEFEKVMNFGAGFHAGGNPEAFCGHVQREEEQPCVLY